VATTPTVVSAAEHLPEVLGEVLDLARRLATPSDLALRLAENLKTEPVAGVRRQCLLALAREFPGHPASREALLAAREDPDAEVRLQVGITLGPEGRATLLGVASGEGADDETTERAVAALGWHLTTAHALAILRHALRTRREGTARACLRALGRRRGPEAVATLAKVLAVEEPSLASVAAEAVGETGDAGAEAPLVEALGSRHEAVRVAAARARARGHRVRGGAPESCRSERSSAAGRGAPGDRRDPVPRQGRIARAALAGGVGGGGIVDRGRGGGTPQPPRRGRRGTRSRSFG
jgi:hypothetical protein